MFMRTGYYAYLHFPFYQLRVPNNTKSPIAISTLKTKIFVSNAILNTKRQN